MNKHDFFLRWLWRSRRATFADVEQIATIGVRLTWAFITGRKNRTQSNTNQTNRRRLMTFKTAGEKKKNRFVNGFENELQSKA